MLLYRVTPRHTTKADHDKARQTIHMLYRMSKELMLDGAGKLFQVIITLIRLYY